MVCLLCLKETNDGIPIFGDSLVAENARNIIVKHFWFDVSHSTINRKNLIKRITLLQINDINSIEYYMCPECWPKVETFHEFYMLVDEIHKSTIEIDSIDIKTTFDPLVLIPEEGTKFEEETETFAEIENDTSASLTPDDDTKYTHGELNSGDSDINSDSYTRENNSNATKTSARVHMTIKTEPRSLRARNYQTPLQTTSSRPKKPLKSSESKRISNKSKQTNKVKEPKNKRIVDQIT